MIDHRRIDGPIDTRNGPRCQFFVERSAFTDQRESVPFFHECLHLGWVRCMRIFVYKHAGVCKQFKQSKMRVVVTLWMVKNGEIIL